MSTKCTWARHLAQHALSYVGQLHSNYMGYQMLAAYEAEKRLRFDWVMKARLDAMWLRAVAPWCSYDRTAVYTAFPAPADWFIMTPREVATPTFRGVYEDYRRCVGSTFDNLQAGCCGGGPTAQMVGAFLRALNRSRSPLIGMPWVGPGSPPTGSMVKRNLWPLFVMRDQIDNVLCKSMYLVTNAAEDALN
eukprot:5570493-Prymnesium_polylepis.1